MYSSLATPNIIIFPDYSCIGKNRFSKLILIIFDLTNAFSPSINIQEIILKNWTFPGPFPGLKCLGVVSNRGTSKGIFSIILWI